MGYKNEDAIYDANTMSRESKTTQSVFHVVRNRVSAVPRWLKATDEKVTQNSMYVVTQEEHPLLGSASGACDWFYIRDASHLVWSDVAQKDVWTERFISTCWSRLSIGVETQFTRTSVLWKPALKQLLSEDFEKSCHKRKDCRKYNAEDTVHWGHIYLLVVNTLPLEEQVVVAETSLDE